MKPHPYRSRLGVLGVCSLVASALWAQVPVQDRKEANAALRPAVMGPTGGVSAGHPLTTAVAFSVLLKGGNAFDAGVAALLVGGVVEQDLYSLGGEALVLVYPRNDGEGRRRSSGRAGRRSGATSTATSRGTRRSRAMASIRPSFPARCMRRSRCSNNGAP